MAVSRCIAVTVTYHYYYIYLSCMTVIMHRLLFSPTIITHSNQPQQPSSPLPSISGKIRVLPVVYRIYSAPAQQVMSPGHAPTSCCALISCTEVKGSNLTLSSLYSLRIKREKSAPIVVAAVSHRGKRLGKKAAQKRSNSNLVFANSPISFVEPDIGAGRSVVQFLLPR